MATHAHEIAEAVERIAPNALAEDWDNPGLQVGDLDGEVDGVLVALTPLPEVFEEAEETGVNFLLFHHPLIFRSLKRVNITSYPGDLISRAVRYNLTVYTAHTNYDAAPEGVSVALAESLGFEWVGTTLGADHFKGSVSDEHRYELRVQGDKLKC